MQALYTYQAGIVPYEGTNAMRAQGAVTISVATGGADRLELLIARLIRGAASLIGVLWRWHRPAQVPWVNATQERRLRRELAKSPPGFTQTFFCEGVAPLALLSQMMASPDRIPIGYLSSYRDTILLGVREESADAKHLCELFGSLPNKIDAPETIEAFRRAGSGHTVIRFLESDTHCVAQLITSEEIGAAICGILEKNGVTRVEPDEVATAIQHL